ncbi:uncharacterized protein METZ01_LOCUS171642 [marine metagenome]|uniref:Uncharacterized protein n=1 Tax=marine metagenome TaxID=408172 RepID=A0A382BYB0_9ZZZZ
MRYAILVLFSFMFMGCVGLYADSEIKTGSWTANSHKHTWRSQSWGFMEYPADEKKLTKFLAEQPLYKDCVAKNGHITQMYQDGMIGDLTLICQEKVKM